MKVALILPAELKKAPYINYYTDVLECSGISYDIIMWNRTNTVISSYNNLRIFNKYSPEMANGLKKLIDYNKFCSFIQKEITYNQYDFLIIHTIMPAVFLSSFLKREYASRYILDIRDMCALYGVMKHFLPSLLQLSALNIISSPGYKKWLPISDYLLSHNIGRDWQKRIERTCPSRFSDYVKIMTIGAIRHYEVNKRVIDIFANKDDYTLIFAGKGNSGEALQYYCTTNKITNVIFTGEYDKEQEDNIISEADFINILLPEVNLRQQAIANRFYSAVLNYKPVIVNCESIQAMYVKKYNLGVVISDYTSVVEKISEYIMNYNQEVYVSGRRMFLQELKQDISHFESELIDKLLKVEK